MVLDWKWGVGTLLAIIAIAIPLYQNHVENREAEIEALKNAETALDMMEARVRAHLRIANEDGFYSIGEPEDPKKLFPAIDDAISDVIKNIKNIDISDDTRTLLSYADLNAEFITSRLVGCRFLDKSAVPALSALALEFYVSRNFVRWEKLLKMGNLSKAELSEAQKKLIKKMGRYSVSYSINSIQSCQP